MPVNSQRGVTISSDAFTGEVFPVNSNVSYKFSDDTPVNPFYEICLDVAVDGIEDLSNIKIKTSNEDGSSYVYSVNVTEAVSSVRIGIANSNGLLKVEYDENGVTHSDVYSLSGITRRKGFVFKNPKTIYDTISGTNPLDAEVGESGIVNENVTLHSKAMVNEDGSLRYDMSIEGRTGLALDVAGQNTADKTLFLELTDEFNALNPGMDGYTFVVGNPPPVALGSIVGNVVKIPDTAWNGTTVNMQLSNSAAMTSVNVVITGEDATETLADSIVTPGEDYVSTDITIPSGFTGTVYKFPGEVIRDFNNEAVNVDSIYRIKMLIGELGADNKITLPIDSSLVEIPTEGNGYFDTSIWIMDYDGNYYATAGRIHVGDTGFPAITFTVPEGVFNVSDPSRAGIVTFSGHVTQVQTSDNVGTGLSLWLFEGSGYFTKPSPTVVPDSLVTTPDMTAQTCAYPAGDTVAVTQSSIVLQDNVDGYGEEFTGTISGQVYGYVDPNEETQYRLGFKINEELIKSTSQIGFKLYDANNNEINLGLSSFSGSEMPADGYIAISVGSTNIGPADPEDIKSIVADYIDFSDVENIKEIKVTYTTNLTKGS